jgi:hypothetical protein
MKQPGDPAWANDDEVKAYKIFLKTYAPSANPDDYSVLVAYMNVHGVTLALKKCGDELTRDNLIRQATSFHGEKLVKIAKSICARHGLRVLGDELRILPEIAAINPRGNRAHEFLVEIATGRCELPKHGRSARHHDRAWRRRREYELSAHLGVLMSKLLRHTAAPGHTRDIDLFMPEPFDKAHGQPRDRRRPTRKRGKRRAADAGYVKNNRFGLFQGGQEWLGKFPIRADSIEHQERRPDLRPAPDGDLQKLAVHLDHLHVNVGRSRVTIHNAVHLLPCMLRTSINRKHEYRASSTSGRAAELRRHRYFLARALYEASGQNTSACCSWAVKAGVSSMSAGRTYGSISQKRVFVCKDVQ